MIYRVSRYFTVKIPVHELVFNYSRSSGPGGQNVNKVNSKVDLRFNIDGAAWISDETKQRLKDHYAHFINKDGEFYLQSQSNS